MNNIVDYADIISLLTKEQEETIDPMWNQLKEIYKISNKQAAIHLLKMGSEVLVGEGDCPTYCPNITSKPIDDACGRDACCIAGEKYIQAALKILDVD